MTSNDVSQLPPELTRAGRLDAIWFFGLPTEEERESILDIHINKTNKEVSKEDVKQASLLMNKYTGAEIELVVKSALRKAYLNKVTKNKDEGITLEVLKAAINEVIPIAVSSREQITVLERWAKSRALFANGTDDNNMSPIKPLPRIIGKRS